jgi:hypothetical protein
MSLNHAAAGTNNLATTCTCEQQDWTVRFQVCLPIALFSTNQPESNFSVLLLGGFETRAWRRAGTRG